MDLLTCPTCKQSVLDEDATECPFCGSPMKAGAAPAKPGGAAGKGSGSGKSSTGKGGAKPEPAKPAEDDPFAVDPSIAAKAVALAPRPAPGRSFEVKCPMCETVGYSSSKVVGHSVKCCNPQCLVPIFTVKAPKKEEPAPPPPPKPKSPIALYAGIIGAVLALGAGAVWFLDSKPRPPVGAAPGQGLNLGIPNAGKGAMPIDPDDGSAVNAQAKKNIEAVPEGAAKDLEEALKRSLEAALQSRPDRKAFGRRMTALAYAHAGDLAGTREHLEQLNKVGAQTPFEKIPPLALYAWRVRPTSDADFQNAVAELKQTLPTLPKRGRFACEAAIAAAAILASSGDHATARQVLADHRAAPLVEQLAAVLQTVNHAGTFDVDSRLPGRAAGNWQAPMESAVTLILGGQGRWEDAEKWATQTSDPLQREESVLVFVEAWGREQLARDPAFDLTRGKKLASDFSAAGQARLAARLAAMQLEAGNAAAAAGLLAEAKTALAAIPQGKAPRISSPKTLLDARLSDALPLRQGARAAAELALVQMQAKQKDAAWETIVAGLTLLRGSGPGLIATQSRQLQLEQDSGAETLKADLKKTLQLRNDDQVRRTLTQYRERLNELSTAAQGRFRGEIDLLQQGIEMGLQAEVWKEVQAVDAKTDDNDREPLLSSALPPLIALVYESAGDVATANKVRAAAAGRVDEAEEAEVLRVIPRVTEQMCANGQVAAAAQQLSSHLKESGEMQEWTLRLACKLVNSGRPAEAIQLIQRIQLDTVREDGYYQTAARAARIDQGTAVLQALPPQIKIPEMSAAQAGLASGWGEAARSAQVAKTALNSEATK